MNFRKAESPAPADYAANSRFATASADRRISVSQYPESEGRISRIKTIRWQPAHPMPKFDEQYVAKKLITTSNILRYQLILT